MTADRRRRPGYGTDEPEEGIPVGALDFPPDGGLLPAVVQSAHDGAVLMLGWMDAEALVRTLEDGWVTFYSRSRDRLWRKGETSGHLLELVEARTDCDRDAILLTARPHGPTCHEDVRSCFDAGPPVMPAESGRNDVAAEASRDGAPDAPSDIAPPADPLPEALSALLAVVRDRDRRRPEGSYTAALLTEGAAAAARKVGEEALETVISALSEPDRVPEESADLLFHLAVLWRALGTDPDQVAEVLRDRRADGP